MQSLIKDPFDLFWSRFFTTYMRTPILDLPPNISTIWVATKCNKNGGFQPIFLKW